MHRFVSVLQTDTQLLSTHLLVTITTRSLECMEMCINPHEVIFRPECII